MLTPRDGDSYGRSAATISSSAFRVFDPNKVNTMEGMAAGAECATFNRKTFYFDVYRL